MNRCRTSTWALGAAVLLAIAASGCGLGGPPSDAVMIAHLQRERVAFDTLVRMMTEDRIVGNLVVDGMPGKSPERTVRREKYRVLLRRTGCRPAYRDEAGRVTFDVPYPTSGGGVAGTGFKGYVYAPTPPAPAPVRTSLDQGGLRRFEDTFRHVDGCWYLARMRV